MTFTLPELVMIVAGVAAIIFVVAFSRLAAQLNKTAEQVERMAQRISDLVPPAHRLIEKSESDIDEIRELTRRTTRIAEDIQAVTGEASGITVQLLRALEGQVSDRARAAIAGARAGFSALRHAKREEESPTNGSGVHSSSHSDD